MRGRLAIASAKIQMDLREIVLRDKAPEFLKASPKGTVPVVVHRDRVIDESLDVMNWALAQNDPEGWLDGCRESLMLITQNDTSFKAALDRTKYASRHDSDPENERAKANVFLTELSEFLGDNRYLCGERPTLADFAILPFIRQFANIDRQRFDADTSTTLRSWLDGFLNSSRFVEIMQKHPKWEDGDALTTFPTQITR